MAGEHSHGGESLSYLRGSAKDVHQLDILSAAMEAGEAPATVLASHEPGFWLSGTSLVGAQ